MNLNSIKDYYDSSYGNRQMELYNYYTGEDVPINHRVPVSAVKAATHTNAHIDFFKDIIDLKVGYMGQNIVYTTENEVIKDELLKFKRINDLDILNSETVRDVSVSGISHRLIYTEDGDVRVKNILGWQVVYEYKHTPLNPERAYYYYETIDLVGNTVKHVDVYDKENVEYFEALAGKTQPTDMEKAESENWGGFTSKGIQPHNFKEVPIVPFLNNDMMFSDCEKVTKLIDVYDEIISDTSAEVKAMRLSYLKLWGNLYTGLDGDGNPIDINRWLTQTSTMRFGTDDEGNKFGDAEFLEKNINDAAIENTLNRIRTHIYETAGSIDLKELTSAERVFSIKASMMRLENTCAITERYMKAGLNKMMRLWAYIMREINNLTVGDYDVDWIFTRTFPRDIEAESRTLANLAPVIGLESALKEMGWSNVDTIVELKNEDISQELNRDLTDENIVNSDN